MKIYAITAMNEKQIDNEYEKFGIEKVLTKPVSTESLTDLFGLS